MLGQYQCMNPITPKGRRGQAANKLRLWLSSDILHGSSVQEMICHGGDRSTPRLNSPIRTLARAVSWTLAALGIAAATLLITLYMAEVLLATSYIAELPPLSERDFSTVPRRENLPQLPAPKWAMTWVAIAVSLTCLVPLLLWEIFFMFWRSPRLEPPHLPKRTAS